MRILNKHIFLKSFLGLFLISTALSQEYDKSLNINVLSEKVLEGMEMDIANDGRVFLAERQGKVKMWQEGKRN